jgi:hypothetical protein
MSKLAASPIEYAAARPAMQSGRWRVAIVMMMAVTTIWLGCPYLCWRGLLNWGPFAGQRGGPLGESLVATELWPCGITVALVLVGLWRTRRDWMLAVAVVVTVVLELLILTPGVYR